MSYTGLIARCEFKDVYQNDWVCRIYNKSTNPTTIEFTGTGAPLYISWLNQGEETHVPIKSSEAVLQLHNLENFQALRILARGNRDALLEIRKNNVVYWRGFMVPEMWNEPFTDTPYPSNITFVDGISLLKNEEFLDDDGCYRIGRFRAWQVVAWCLDEIGIRKRFIDQVNFADVNQTVQLGTLYERFYDVEAFRGMTCYDVLHRILSDLTSRITYRNDTYYITRIDEVKSQTYGWAYEVTSTGWTYAGASNETSRHQYYTCSNEPKSSRSVFLFNEQQLERLLSYKKLTVNHIYGRKESMLSRWNFVKCDWIRLEGDEGITARRGDVLKNWNVAGVKYAEVEENPCVEFRTWRPDTDPYQKPAYIEQVAPDPYDNTNVTSDNFEKFAVDITLRAGTYRYTEDKRYYGPRPSTGSTIAGTEIQPSQPYQSITSIECMVANPPNQVRNVIGQGLAFAIIVESGEELLEKLPHGLAVGDRIVFRSGSSSPIGFAAGEIYRVVVQQFDIVRGRWWFRLHNIWPAFLVSPWININANDENKKFQISTVLTYIPVNLQLGLSNDDPNLNIRGEFPGRGYLDMEIQKSDIDARRFFGIGTLAEDRPLTNETLSPIFMRIEKPLDTLASRPNEGSFYVENVKVYLEDTPDKQTLMQSMNQDSNRELTIDVWFAETPIKTNFRNNNLKFYHNLYSLSTTVAPGAQYVREFDPGSDPPQTMLEWITFFYWKLYINPRNILRGKVNSPDIDLFGKIMLDEYTERKYIMAACEFDVRNAIFDGEWHEINQIDITEQQGAYSNDYSLDYE